MVSSVLYKNVNIMNLTARKRIALNTTVTYVRSVYALAAGLLLGRWCLIALGQTDYGLSGVVGGLAGFVTFFNNLLAFAVGRFYAFSIGEAQKEGNQLTGLDVCRRWFNVALLIHIVLPTILIIIGYPLGLWAVRHYLTIPPDRVEACVWVWRFTCISCFVVMAGVPFTGMFIAKQEIAELTIYSFFTTTANVCVLYYMVTHPGDWLATFSFCLCLFEVVPTSLQIIRAITKYPECRFVRSYLWNWEYIKKVTLYASCRLWTALSSMWSAQGVAILVNKNFGASANATIHISNTVAAQTSKLSASLSNAFWPAITNAAGEGDMVKVRSYVLQVCKWGALLMLFFSIPLCLEVHEVFRLWLKEPPQYAAELCVAVLVCGLLEKMTDGCWMGVMSLNKRVATYSSVIGFTGLIAFFIAWIGFGLKFGLIFVAIARIISLIYSASIRLFFGVNYVGFTLGQWNRQVLIPVIISIGVCGGLGFLPHLFLAASIYRVLISCAICCASFLSLTWICFFSDNEREMILLKIRQLAKL